MAKTHRRGRSPRRKPPLLFEGHAGTLLAVGDFCNWLTTSQKGRRQVDGRRLRPLTSYCGIVLEDGGEHRDTFGHKLHVLVETEGGPGLPGAYAEWRFWALTDYNDRYRPRDPSYGRLMPIYRSRDVAFFDEDPAARMRKNIEEIWTADFGLQLAEWIALRDWLKAGSGEWPQVMIHSQRPVADTDGGWIIRIEQPDQMMLRVYVVTGESYREASGRRRGRTRRPKPDPDYRSRNGALLFFYSRNPWDDMAV